MRRVVIDTNIYIDWFNVGRHEDVVFQRDAVKHLSDVVLWNFALEYLPPALAGSCSESNRHSRDRGGFSCRRVAYSPSAHRDRLI
jgi:hypothetical protein